MSHLMQVSCMYCTCMFLHDVTSLLLAKCDCIHVFQSFSSLGIMLNLMHVITRLIDLLFGRLVYQFVRHSTTYYR
jgi:hypothetical protein